VALRVASLARCAAAAFATAAMDEALGGDQSRWGRASRLSRTARDLCLSHGIVARVTGAPLTRPAVYVANHLSYVDAPVVAQFVPCVPIAKAEVER